MIAHFLFFQYGFMTLFKVGFGHDSFIQSSCGQK